MKNLLKFYKKLNKYWKLFLLNIQTIFSGVYTFIKKYKYISLVVLIIVILFFGYIYHKKSDTLDFKKDVPKIVEQVGKLIMLPQGETPVMFEISDPNILVTKEPFFIGAEKGDILLIYQRAGKAIIYNPKKNMIINFGPLVNTK